MKYAHVVSSEHVKTLSGAYHPSVVTHKEEEPNFPTRKIIKFRDRQTHPTYPKTTPRVSILK